MNRFAPALFVSLAFLAAETAARPAHAADPRTHEGFQFRGVIGGGYLSDSESPESATISGPAAGFELYVGGNVIPGLAVGGFLGGASAANPSVSLNGQSLGTATNASLTLAMIGPYVDWYFDPTGGFHLMGMLEFTRLAVTTGGGGVSSETPVGGGIGAGVGYDFWLSDTFSMGVLGRVNFSSNSYSDGGTNFTDKTINPMLFLSFSYH
jgi:outer membrane protein with beta-barrel domain